MTNYVRSHFCVENPIRQSQFYRLMQKLDRLGCKYNVSKEGVVVGYLEPGKQSLRVKEQTLDDSSCPTKLQQLAAWLATPGLVDITLGWQVGDVCFLARLTKWKYASDRRARISFDVSDSAFLSNSIAFTPDSRDRVYNTFKQIIVQLVKQLQPLVGVIDEEADLLCDTLSQYRSMVSWGNFFSHSLLEQWSQSELCVLRQSVDEYVEVDDLGVLTFIHPLAANQAWSARHEKVCALLLRNRFGEDR